MFGYFEKENRRNAHGRSGIRFLSRRVVTLILVLTMLMTVAPLAVLAYEPEEELTFQTIDATIYTDETYTEPLSAADDPSPDDDNPSGGPAATDDESDAAGTDQPDDTGDGDSKSDDTGSGDTESGDTGSGDTGSGDTESGDTQSGDTESGDTESGDTGSGDTGSGDTESGDTESGDTGSGDSESGDIGSGATGSGDSESGDTKSDDAKSDDAKSGDTGSGDSKSGDTKSGDSKGGDSKSDDAKSGDAKSGDAKGDDTKSGDSKSDDTKSGDTKGDDTKSGDNKSDDNKSGDNKSGDSGKSADEFLGERKDGSGETSPSGGDSEPQLFDSIHLSGKMPKNAVVAAYPVTVEINGKAALVAYDIKVFANSTQQKKGNVWQPSGDKITVTLESPGLSDAEGTLNVYHMQDADAEPELVTTVQAESDAVTFEADSFSVYAIVNAPSPFMGTSHKIMTLSELISHGSTGFYIGHVDGYYFTAGTYSPSSSRKGVLKTKPASAEPAAEAVPYYLEQVGDNFRFYCLDADNTPHYLTRSPSANSLSFTTTVGSATAFTIAAWDGKPDGTFRVSNGGYYINQQGGVNGKGFCCYNTADDNNNALFFWYRDAVTTDFYGLDGQSYGMMNYTGGIAGRALMAEEIAGSDPGALTAQNTLVMAKNATDKLYAPVDTDMTVWTFHWSEDSDYYYLQADNGQYMSVTAAGLALVDTQGEASKLQFVPGAGDYAGKFCLRTSGGISLTFSGSNENGFSIGGTAGSEWLYLVRKQEGVDTSDYLRTYSARKTSVSAVPNGEHVLVYTRVWNDTDKRYEFYAVDGEGKLTPCFENGDSIQWLGSSENKLIWDFTEYWWEGTTDPNDYYELYNESSGKYLAPQVTDGQLVSDGTIGLNLAGRSKGYYQSTIVAWDDANYSFAGLIADVSSDPKTLVSVSSVSDLDEFYFAIMEELPINDDLNDITTVDNSMYGITMKIKDFDAKDQTIAKNPMSAFLNNDAGGLGTALQQGLLSSDLKANGYPDAASGSLATLFSGEHEVNHLFIQSTYDSSGYYEFDSSQNFATLVDKDTGSIGSDFRVYKQIGTYDSTSKPSLKHGQFFPFNDIEPGYFASVNKYNLYDAETNLLPDTDPRKNEQLYLIKDVNCFFAVEIEASFTQTPDGRDNWGHDIIYEFTGDDDFWLYVDGELIIDLGGVHSAVPGSVNYATGDVMVNGTPTTLRALFEQNFRARYYDEHGAEPTDAEVLMYLEGDEDDPGFFADGGTVFRPYTTHTMRIFYMERGAGASNLHMRFNLASVRPGTVLLTKQLDGVEDTETVLAEFPFQIYYYDEGGEADPILLTQTDDAIKVLFKDTPNKVPHRASFTIPGTDITYEHVFLLKPGETAEIDIPDDGIYYKIVECGVNTDVYEKVTANETVLTGTDIEGSANRKDFSIAFGKTNERSRVTFVNKVRPSALCNLTIKKELYDFDGTTLLSKEDDDTLFSFRLSLGTEYDPNLNLTNSHAYHVRDEAGNYCRWNAATQKFVSLGETDFTSLTVAAKRLATFNTSIRGSISKIPAGYSVEIRDLLAGTRFQVVERPTETEDGYLLQEYVYYTDDAPADTTLVTDAWTGITDTVVAGKNPVIEVQNKRVWGLRVNKTWSDAADIASRDPAYFALYTDDGTLTLVDGSVRVMPYTAKPAEQTLYWYYEGLESDLQTGDFDNYVIREVRLTGSVVVDDDTGVVTSYGTVTPAASGERLSFNATPEEGAADEFHYTVAYPTVTTEKGHIKKAAVTNTRDDTPVILMLTDMEGSPLEGATFTRVNGSTGQSFTHTSDDTGQIAVSYLQEDVTYTLTETVSTLGHQGLADPITFTVHAGEITVTSGDDTYYTLSDPATLTVKNRPYTLTVHKQDRDTSDPLAAEFALYKQGKVDGVTVYSIPDDSYSSLSTDASGDIVINTAILAPGTYQLREKTAPGGYLSILEDAIVLIVSNTGYVTLSREDPSYLSNRIATETDAKTCEYTLTVQNQRQMPSPTGLTISIVPFIVLVGSGLLLTPICLAGKKRGRHEAR